MKRFYETRVLERYPKITYDEILILQGNDPDAWAYSAEAGAFYVFGEEVKEGKGGGYSFCRGGDKAKKRYHFYVCVDK